MDRPDESPFEDWDVMRAMSRKKKEIEELKKEVEHWKTKYENLCARKGD
jgi:hypothetical protein